MVDHASQQTFRPRARPSRGRSARPFVASVQATVVPEQDDTDLFFIEIECNAKQTGWGTSHRLVTNAGKTGECLQILVETFVTMPTSWESVLP